jgi:phosphate transport system protein
MAVHFVNEIIQLKKSLLTLGAAAEERLRAVLRSMAERDPRRAREVIDGDDEIDAMEIRIEEDCLKILALYHPVASDLRFIVAVLKMNNDLERIGDLAKNIASRALVLAGQPALQLPDALARIGEKAIVMVTKCLDALVNLDDGLAGEVCRLDDEVDALNAEIYEDVRRRLPDHPDSIDALIHVLAVSRSFERVADHATNIAEDVIYMLRGDIVRHQG